MSIKKDLIGEQFVKGNMTKGLQVYKIYYYPPEVNFPTSKIWLYFNRKQDNKYLGIKSLCFENIENHRNFIVNNIFSQLFWLEKEGIRYKPDFMTIDKYKEKLLEGLLLDINKKISMKVKKEEKIKLMH